MPKPFRLEILLQHSRHRMEAAERMLRMLRRKEEVAQKQLDDLHGYRQEYQQRMTGAGAHGLDITLLRDYHRFLGKVEAAIDHQIGEVAQAHGKWQAAHAAWMELRRQVKAYEVLAERHAREVRHLEEKREQRATDETAARQTQPLGGRTLG